MATFRGLLEVEGEADSTVISDIEVAEGRITFQAGGSELGDWNLNDIKIELGEDSFRIEADDEVPILRVRDAKRFAATVGSDLPNSESDDLHLLTPVPTAPPVAPQNDLSALLADDSDADDRAVADKRSTKGPTETHLARPLAWGLAGGAALLFIGAFFSWGPWRLAGRSFPMERFLVGVAGLAAVASTYLALAQEKRRDVALVAMLSAFIAAVTAVLYAAEAGIGAGYLITIVAGVAVATISVLSLTRFGAPSEDGDLDVS